MAASSKGTAVEENATVVRYEALAGCLFRLWIKPDWDLGAEAWEPGQFVRLGMVTGADTDKKDARAYSFVGVRDGVFEFYLVAVEGGRTSPRLAELREGARLWCEHKISGHFTLSRNPEGSRCLMVCTGAGIAPFTAMIRHGEDELAKYDQVAVVHQVRDVSHLCYGAELAAWAVGNPMRRYVPILSKPTARLHVRDGHAALHGYVQDAIGQGVLDRVLGAPLTAESTVAMLCGNPAMIKAVTTALEGRGFAKHRKSKPGQIVSERYW